MFSDFSHQNPNDAIAWGNGADFDNTILANSDKKAGWVKERGE